MSLSNVKSIEVIFKRSKLQWIQNLFREKAKRYPKVATFTGFIGYRLTEAGLTIGFGKTRYFYPMHQIGRIKFVQH